MKVGSLFSGIGGFDLGLERAGMEVVWQVEIDEFCNKVLAKHWPNVKRYGDIKNVTNLEPVDLICGGFPCQPFSCAGKRRGKEDDRYLWPEMFRVIQEAKPTWVIGENVGGFVNMGLDQCVSDLEAEGYEVEPIIIPACAVNAPHRRDRVWIVANSNRSKSRTSPSGTDENRSEIIQEQQLPQSEYSGQNFDVTDTTNTGIKNLRRERQNAVFQNAVTADSPCRETQSAESWRLHAEPCGKDSNVSYTTDERLQRSVKTVREERQKSNDELLHGCRGEWREPWIEVAARLCRVDDGIPPPLDRVKRLKALGNAVVPQVVEIIGRAIMETESLTTKGESK